MLTHILPALAFGVFVFSAVVGSIRGTLKGRPRIVIFVCLGIIAVARIISVLAQ